MTESLTRWVEACGVARKPARQLWAAKHEPAPQEHAVRKFRFQPTGDVPSLAPGVLSSSTSVLPTLLSKHRMPVESLQSSPRSQHPATIAVGLCERERCREPTEIHRKPRNLNSRQHDIEVIAATLKGRYNEAVV